MVCPKVMAERRVSSTLVPDVVTLEIEVAEPSISISSWKPKQLLMRELRCR